MSTFLFINIKSLVIELLIITAIISAILVIISKNPVVSVIYLISLILNAALFLIVKGMPFIGISYILIYLGAIIVLFLFVIMMININLTDILETGFNYTKNIPLALVVSGLFIYEFINILPSYLNNSVLSLNNSLLYSIYIDSVLFINNLVLALSSVYDIGSEGFSFTYIGGGHQINLFFNELNEHYYPLMASNNWPETFISSYSHIVSIAYSLYTYGIFLFLITSVILLLALITPIYLSERQY